MKQNRFRNNLYILIIIINMEEKTIDTILRDSAFNLTKTASEVSKKIKKQALIFESIQVETSKQSEKLSKNSMMFQTTVDEIEKDKRNQIIFVLLIIVICLIFYIRS